MKNKFRQRRGGNLRARDDRRLSALNIEIDIVEHRASKYPSTSEFVSLNG